jgi:hypothetical protein
MRDSGQFVVSESDGGLAGRAVSDLLVRQPARTRRGISLNSGVAAALLEPANAEQHS